MRILLIAFIFASINAKAELATNFNNKSPIDISSDDLEVDQEKNQAVFTGHVIVTQDDIEINSDKMIVYFTKKEDKASKSFELDTSKINHQETEKDDLSSELANIDKISASGHVKFIGDDRQAYANFADYSVDNKILEMHSKVKLVHNQSVVYGDRLIYDLQKNKAQVISDKKSKSKTRERVKLIIGPKAEKKK